MSFDHYLLISAYTIKVYARQGSGRWAQLTQAKQDTMTGAFAQAQGQMAKLAPSQDNTLADFMVGVTRGTLARGPLDFAQILYPFLAPGSGTLIKQVNPSEVIGQAEGYLESLGGHEKELGEWRVLHKDLELARRQLEKGVAGREASGLDELSARYLKALDTLQSPPARPATAALQSFQTSALWLAGAYREFADFADLAPNAKDYQARLAQVPGGWMRSRAGQQATLCLGAMHVLMMGRESQSLGALLERVAENPKVEAVMGKALRQAQDGLLQSARRWQAVASHTPARGGRGALAGSFLVTLARGLAERAVAALEAAGNPGSMSELLVPTGFTQSVLLAMGRASDLTDEGTVAVLKQIQAGNYAIALKQESSAIGGGGGRTGGGGPRIVVLPPIRTIDPTSGGPKIPGVTAGGGGGGGIGVGVSNPPGMMGLTE
jgi:hypothetical protein